MAIICPLDTEMFQGNSQPSCWGLNCKGEISPPSPPSNHPHPRWFLLKEKYPSAHPSQELMHCLSAQLTLLAKGLSFVPYQLHIWQSFHCHLCMGLTACPVHPLPSVPWSSHVPNESLLLEGLNSGCWITVLPSRDLHLLYTENSFIWMETVGQIWILSCSINFLFYSPVK